MGKKHPAVPAPPAVNLASVPSVAFVLKPVRLTIRDAALYIAATNWRMEELVRNGEIPFQWSGKQKVVDVRDLDVWADRERQRPAQAEAA